MTAADSATSSKAIVPDTPNRSETDPAITTTVCNAVEQVQLELLGKLSNGRLYRTEDYLAAAARVERLNAEECHPVLYAEREQFAERLRAMAQRPTEPSHTNALRKLYLLDYTTWIKK